MPGNGGFGGLSNCSAWEWTATNGSEGRRAGGYTDIVATDTAPFFTGGAVACPYGSGKPGEVVPISGVTLDPDDPKKDQPNWAALARAKGTNRTSGCTTWDNFTGSVWATVRAPNYYKHNLCGPMYVGGRG